MGSPEADQLLTPKSYIKWFDFSGTTNRADETGGDKALRIVGVFAVLHFGRIAPREDLSEKMTRVVQM